MIIEPLNYSLEHEILETKKFSFPIYHDEMAGFIKENELGALVNDRAAVLDRKNQIIFLGSPFVYSELADGFFAAADD